MNANGFSVSVANAAGANGWTLTNSSTTAVTLTGSANNDLVTSSTAGDTINTGAGSDTVTINAGTFTNRAWTVDLGADSATDKVVFTHASLGISENTVATVSNFDVANDRVAITLGGAAIADGAFQTVTATQTNISAGVEVVELVNASWVGSLTAMEIPAPLKGSLLRQPMALPQGTTRSSSTRTSPAPRMRASIR